MVQDLRIELHECLSLCRRVQLIPPTHKRYGLNNGRTQEVRTYALGHHLWAIVCILEHWGTNNLDAFYVGQRSGELFELI